MNDFLANPTEHIAKSSGSDIGLDAGMGATLEESFEPLDAQVIANLERVQIVYNFLFLAKLIELFLRDAPRHVAVLRVALDQTDAHAVRQAAHALKGGSYQLGAVLLAQSCETMEQHAQQKQLETCREAFSRLESEFFRVQQALDARLKAGSL